MNRERRRAPRYHLVAEAEILIPLSLKSFKARTSDLSLFGCFMNTPYSLAPGTEIQLKLTYAGTIFKAHGAVARSEPSAGFGVEFSAINGPERTLLQNWLNGLTAA